MTSTETTSQPASNEPASDHDVYKAFLLARARRDKMTGAEVDAFDAAVKRLGFTDDQVSSDHMAAIEILKYEQSDRGDCVRARMVRKRNPRLFGSSNS